MNAGWDIRGLPAKVICPRCRARQFGAAAGCTNCGRDLLPGRSPTFRIFSGIAAIFFFLAAVVIAANPDRVPITAGWIALAVLLALVAVFVAAMPGSTAHRYAQRGRSLLQTDPRQALRDFTHAAELDPKDDSYIPERAQALSLLGQHERAAHDLQGYLQREGRKPLSQVTYARRVLSHIESRSESTRMDRPMLVRQRAMSSSVPNRAGIGSLGRSSGRRSSRSRAGVA